MIGELPNLPGLTELPDLTTEARALRVCKRPIQVAVSFARDDQVCETLEGPVRAQSGDAILTGARGERWPVRRDLFLASYTPVPPTEAGRDGHYVKAPSVSLALRLDREMEVPVGWRNDPLRGRPGDWLLRYEDGSFGVIGDSIFRETYGPEAGEQRWPPP